MKKKYTKKGLTLIELVIYMGILSLLLVIFIDMFALLVNKQLETESLSAVQHDSNYILARLSYDFGRAEAIMNPQQPGVSSPSAKLLIDSTILEVYEQSGNIVASRGGVMTNLNSSETTISNLSFRRIGTGNIYDTLQIACDVVSVVKKQTGYEVNHFFTTLGTREK